MQKSLTKFYQSESNNTLKRSYTMTKWALSQGCKDSSISANPHQSENGCDGWNLLLAVPANDLRATASSERCVQIQGCKDNRSSLWTKALSEAVNPTSCVAQHPEIVWFLLKGWQGKGVLVESSLADRDWPRLLLALPGCWIFKWKLGLRSWTELWELSCGQEM